MRTQTIAATVLLVAAGLPLAASDWVRVEPDVGLYALSGNVSFTSNGLTGTTSDVSGLGLDKRTASPGFEVDISPPLLPIGFNFGGYQFAEKGTKTLSKNLNFGGNPYSIGTSIDSELTLRDLYGEINAQPLHWGLAGASLGIAVHQLSEHVSVSGLGVKKSLDRSVTYPAASVRAYVSPIDSVQIEASVQAFRLNSGKNKVGYTDAKAQVGWFPLPVHYLGVFAGYHYIRYDLTLEPSSSQKLDAKLTVSGPYLGLEARF